MIKTKLSNGQWSVTYNSKTIYEGTSIIEALSVVEALTLLNKSI